MVEKTDVAAVLELIRPSLQADGGVEVVSALTGVVISVVQGLELRDGCRSLVLESVGSADHPPDEQHGGRDRDSQHAPDHGRNPVVSAMSAS